MDHLAALLAPCRNPLGAEAATSFLLLASRVLLDPVLAPPEIDRRGEELAA